MQDRQVARTWKEAGGDEALAAFLIPVAGKMQPHMDVDAPLARDMISKSRHSW